MRIIPKSVGIPTLVSVVVLLAALTFRVGFEIGCRVSTESTKRLNESTKRLSEIYEAAHSSQTPEQVVLTILRIEGRR